MRENWKTLAIGIPIGVFFLWLAFRDVDFNEVLSYFKQISYGWIFPFVVISVTSYLARAERWILLLGKERKKARRSTFFAGTFFGYLVNYAVPRLGEVSRCVYVSKRDQIPTLTLIGTVVLERVIDTLMLLIMVIILFVYVITDEATIIRLFGENNAKLLSNAGSIEFLGGLVLVGLLGIGLFYLILRLLKKWADKESLLGQFSKKVVYFFNVFWEGILNIRKVHNWPYFILLTVFIWLCFIFMAYIPLWMLDIHTTYSLNILDAAVIMVMSAVGITLPSPGGVGTYHFIVSQSLFVLYGVVQSEGLAYAFVSHFAMLILIGVFTPLLITLNSFILRKLSR